jgi:hypothetical protein
VEIPTFEQAVADRHVLGRFQAACYQATKPPADRAGFDDVIHGLHHSAGLTAWGQHLRPYAEAVAAEASARNAFAAERTPERRKALKQAIQARETAETSARAWWDTQQGHLGEAAARAAGPKPWQPPQAPRVQAVMFTN